MNAMIRSDILEQPGKWRIIGITTGFLIVATPALVLMFVTTGAVPGRIGSLIGGAFGWAILRSLAVASLAAVFSLAVGLPAGIVAALYDFSARRLLLGLLALPLLLPSFIQAIGLSLLRPVLGLSADGFLSGLSGVALSFALFGIPLVLFITLASVRGISRSQVDAARLAGGEWHVVGCVARSVFSAAALAGALAGVLTLSDPGPGQILGYNGAAAEILVSFASQYDFALATRQCLLLAGVVFVLSLPVALRLAPRLATGLLARDVTPVPLTRNRAASHAGPALLLGLLVFILVLPLAGFVRPLFGNFPVGRVAQEVARTLGDTLAYGTMAGLLAVVLGVALAACAGRSAKMRIGVLCGLVLVLAAPPSLGALGWIHLAGVSPASLDPVLRSMFTVSLALALRFFPIVTLFAMRGLGTVSPSWAGAAAVHGVSFPKFVQKVLAPWLAPAVLMAALLVVLLATADVSSVLLLHPPGRGSLPLAIFTVMANAPESLVGALCLAYVGGAAGLLGLGWWLVNTFKTKS
jgi:iron(III) transport system permease protein